MTWMNSCVLVAIVLITLPIHTSVIADGVALLELPGNCVVFAWSNVVGLRDAINHMASAPPMYWNGLGYVRDMMDWAQICNGAFSIGSPVGILPVATSFNALPFFAIYTLRGVLHVECVYMHPNGNPDYIRRCRISGFIETSLSLWNKFMSRGGGVYYLSLIHI